jgi:hypothetical protein
MGEKVFKEREERGRQGKKEKKKTGVTMPLRLDRHAKVGSSE